MCFGLYLKNNKNKTLKEKEREREKVWRQSLAQINNSA
jgi:hypothetical protein